MSQPSYESGLLFTQAHAAVRDSIYSILKEYDLTPSYWAILGASVNAEEGIRLANVAKLMGVKAPLVTMLANSLIEKNLIKRLPHHSDGRAKLLVATPNGKKMAQKIEHELAVEIGHLMRGATKDEVTAFQKTLRIILANASS
jgi:DNA-binding MarR family transcriptional regulator